MSNELQFINDGDGVAILGDARLIDLLLDAEQLPSRELNLQWTGSGLNRAAGAVQAGSEISAASGRWVKLSEKSARALKQGSAMKGSDVHLSRAVVTKNGKISDVLEFLNTPTSMLANPAILAGAAGIMAQLAMQQTMDEITAYLRVIDEKVDDILRAQKDAVIADMIGVGLIVDEAMILRNEVGRVSDTTWSKVQGSAAIIARTQAYALRQLEALAEKVEKQRSVTDLVAMTEAAESGVREWLAVLARSAQLQDALSVLELDRVLASSPAEVHDHRRALQRARQRRVEAISGITQRLIDRMNDAAGTANDKVLFRPFSGRKVVHRGQSTVAMISDFREHLGIEGDQERIEARPWREAASDAREKVLVTASRSVISAQRAGVAAYGRSKGAASSLSEGIAARVSRRRNRPEDETPDENTFRDE